MIFEGECFWGGGAWINKATKRNGEICRRICCAFCEQFSLDSPETNKKLNPNPLCRASGSRSITHPKNQAMPLDLGATKGRIPDSSYHLQHYSDGRQARQIREGKKRGTMPPDGSQLRQSSMRAPASTSTPKTPQTQTMV